MNYTQETLKIFNGYLTIQSPTGDHRTFAILTGHAEWNKNRRVLYLKTGPVDGDKQAIAWVDGSGAVTLFKKYQFHPTYKVYARMLMFPEGFQAKGARYLFESVCRKCNRPLTVPSSIDRGLGPICAQMTG